MARRGSSGSVALRKESVDRNVGGAGRFARRLVALRKESVDRNAGKGLTYADVTESLSARRAWIEISPCAARFTSPASRSPQGERG